MTRLSFFAEWKKRFCKQKTCECICDDTFTVAEWFICSFSEYNGEREEWHFLPFECWIPAGGIDVNTQKSAKLGSLILFESLFFNHVFF